MAPRLSGQPSIFGVVFFVSKSLLGIETQEKLEKFAILTRKPRSHVRIERFSTAFTANGKRQAEISRLPKTREIYLVSGYILPVSHSYMEQVLKTEK